MAAIVTVAASEARSEVTEDGLLDNRVRLRQPGRGYRVSIDTVLLAAAADPPSGAQVLDVGAGVGGLGLCLLARRPDLSVIGIERQPSLAALAAENAALNGLAEQFRVVCASVADGGQAMRAVGLQAGSVDHVVTNPPYHDATADPSPDPSRALADREAEVSLGQWIAFCLSALRRGGGLTLVQRADRLGEILAALAGQAGAVRIFPLWPSHDRPARRVIVTALKGRRTAATLLPGLVLHDPTGHFTDAANAVLRDAAALPLAGTVGAPPSLQDARFDSPDHSR